MAEAEAGAEGGGGRASHDLQVFRDQLREVEADARRGLLSPEEAAATRTEVSRRLLAAALQSFYEVREVPGIKKKPSTSEVLDWLKLILAEDLTAEDLRRDGADTLAALRSSIALTTLITLLLYNLVQIVENIVLTRMGMTPGAR